MIDATTAIRTARALIGTPYSELDCINLIKKVIRTAPGGDKSYTTAGTNDLWNSDSKSAKYRDLTWKQEGISGAKAGMLAFMGVGTGDVNHTGLVTECGHGDPLKQEPGRRGRNRADGKERLERAWKAPDDCGGRRRDGGQRRGRERHRLLHRVAFGCGKSRKGAICR